ncbi:MAG: nucleotide exchange factor GrpE [Patescibacteria group bacterium]|nr:nucleotide exchange factor GrpE [Patescibacteria group bacterium]MDE2438666.1 nucleotide exchange factor GrpE [Patescibacteria group bacterium]
MAEEHHNEEQGGEESIEQLKQERAEYLAGWQRARADYANFQKGEAARFAEVQRFGNERFVLDLLTVLDSFDAAQQLLQDEALVQELARVEEQMKNILKQHGVSEIVVVPYKEAQPLEYEAIEAIPSEEASGTIVEVVQKGYALNGKIIRPAKVKVAQ